MEEETRDAQERLRNASASLLIASENVVMTAPLISIEIWEIAKRLHDLKLELDKNTTENI